MIYLAAPLAAGIVLALFYAGHRVGYSKARWEAEQERRARAAKLVQDFMEQDATELYDWTSIESPRGK